MKYSAISRVLFVIMCVNRISQIKCATILLIGEKNETNLVSLFTESLPSGTTAKTLYIDHEQEETQYNDTICQFLTTASFSAMVDLSWGGWEDAQKVAESINMPYIWVEVGKVSPRVISVCWSGSLTGIKRAVRPSSRWFPLPKGSPGFSSDLSNGNRTRPEPLLHHWQLRDASPGYQPRRNRPGSLQTIGRLETGTHSLCSFWICKRFVRHYFQGSKNVIDQVSNHSFIFEANRKSPTSLLGEIQDGILSLKTSQRRTWTRRPPTWTSRWYRCPARSAAASSANQMRSHRVTVLRGRSPNKLLPNNRPNWLPKPCRVSRILHTDAGQSDLTRGPRLWQTSSRRLRL